MRSGTCSRKPEGERARRLAVIFDAVEERWPSMEFIGEMLLLHLQREHGDRFDAVAHYAHHFLICLRRFPGLGRQRAWNADRVVTRFVTYPTQLLAARRRHELFHVAGFTATPRWRTYSPLRGLASTATTWMRFRVFLAEPARAPRGAGQWPGRSSADFSVQPSSSTAPSKCKSRSATPGFWIRLVWCTLRTE